MGQAQYIPLHVGEVVIIPSLRVRVFIWRTLAELRLANGWRKDAKVFGLAVTYRPAEDHFASLHFAKSCLDLETIAHEVSHCMSHFSAEHHLDDAESDDDEIRADLTGKLVDLVFTEVQKLK